MGTFGRLYTGWVWIIAFETGICCLRMNGTDGGVLSWTWPVLKSMFSFRSKE